MRSLVGVEVPGDVLNVPLRHPQLCQVLLSVSQTCPEFLQKLTSSRSLRPREELDVEAELSRGPRLLSLRLWRIQLELFCCVGSYSDALAEYI